MTGLEGTGVPQWRGGVATARASCVLAPNPGPLTLGGTNTWLVGEPGSGRIVVIDPGPADGSHAEAVLAEAARRSAVVEAVLITHGHRDHADLAAHLARRTGSELLTPRSGLTDGRILDAGGAQLEVIATPGHSADSMSLLVRDDAALIAGDSILGHGTSVIAYPDGHLAAYLGSLRRIRRLSEGAPPRVQIILPGHGPVVRDAARTLDAYLEHRAERLAHVEASLRRLGATTRLTPTWVAAGDRELNDLAQRVVEDVYAEVPQAVWPAARASVLAQLEFIAMRDDPAAGSERQGR